MKNKIESIFPIGIVNKKAFIGREDELSWLTGNIEGGIHTLILAPRRYGKSSLAIHCLEKMGTPFVEIDLQLCRSPKATEQKFIKSVEQLTSSLFPETQNLIKITQQFFKKSNKRWDIGLKDLAHMSIEPQNNDSSAENILTALQLLDTALGKIKQSAVLFVDELQEIVELDKECEIQGAIRHFAQKSQWIRFIFSGSNRRLLTHMFDDSKMPLYQLCDKIILTRIREEHYQRYLKKVAKQTWGEAITEDLIKHILALTERHPRRTYNLCLYLWRMTADKANPPSNKDVDRAWERLINLEERPIRSFLAKLPTGQLKTLAYIAIIDGKNLRGQSASQKLQLSTSAISKSLQQLEDADLIAKDDAQNDYFIIDPALRWILSLDDSTLL